MYRQAILERTLCAAAFPKCRENELSLAVTRHRAFFFRKDSEVIPFSPVKLPRERRVTYGGFEGEGGRGEVGNFRGEGELFTGEVPG